MQFEKQIRDLASLSISQVTAPDTPNSKVHCRSTSNHSQTSSPKSLVKPDHLPQSSLEKEPLPPKLHEFDLLPEKEALLKSSLSELRSSLNSLISSADFFNNSMNTLKKSSDWKYSETNKIRDESIFTFQEGLQIEENDLKDTKKSSMMSALRESDLKNSKETSSEIRVRELEKPFGTPVSDMFADSEKPSSNFNKACLTLDELQKSNSNNSVTVKLQGRDSPFFGSASSFLKESWLEQGGIGYIPVIMDGKKIVALDYSQEFEIGKTLLSQVIVSGKSSQGGFQVYQIEEKAISAGLNSRNQVQKLLKVGVSGPAIPLTKYSALHSLVTPLEVLALGHYMSPKLNK